MDVLIQNILQPFQFSFVTNAMIITIMVAIPMAMLSCFLVLKGWSLMGDAVSHAVLPGIVLAYIIKIPLVIGAFVAGMICALLTGFLNTNSRVKEDTVMGVVFSGMFALGLVMMTKVSSDIHLDHILFGDILGISLADIYQSTMIAMLSFFVIMVKRQQFIMNIFDAQHARAVGLSSKFYDYLLLTILALMIVAALSSIGLILSIAFLITPGAIAFLLSKTFTKLILIAILVSVSCSFMGIYVSFYIDSSPAPTIVVLMSILFILVYLSQTIKIKNKSI